MSRQVVALIVMVVAAVLLPVVPVASGSSVSAQGSVARVTVYRGQALVTRSVEVELPADGSEIVVSDLPPNIIPESIYAQAADDVKVLSGRDSTTSARASRLIPL